MSALSNIVHKILGEQDPSKPENVIPTPQPALLNNPLEVYPADEVLPSMGNISRQGDGASGQHNPDVKSVLTDMEKAHPQDLDWKHSMVDFLRLLNLDSSLEARQAIAKELEYDGDFGDEDTLDPWLHRHVMREVAKRGGNVPEELLA